MCGRRKWGPAARGAIAFLVLAALAIGGRARAQSAVDISGYLTAQYRDRASGSERSQLLFAYLGLDVGNSMTSPASFHMLARGAMDLNPHRGNDDFHVFDTILDTYSSQYSGQIYYAYLDINSIKGIDLIRLGRQVIYDTPIPVYFDGGRLETSDKGVPLGFKIGLYGGWPVHLYEPNPEGNSLVGGMVQIKPWEGARLQGHWIHAEGDYLFGKVSNNLYAANYFQSFGPYLRSNASYSWIDGKPRDWSGGIIFNQPASNTIITARYYELIEPQSFYAIDFDPFFAALKEMKPYRQASAMVYQGLGDNFGISGGVDGRWLKDRRDESRFNHEFLRYYVTLEEHDLGVEGLKASVTGESFQSYTNEDHLVTYAADVSYRPDPRFKFSVGTAYDLYKFDYYLNTETEQVRTYYARLRWAPVKSVRTDLEYRYEAGEHQDLTWLQIGLTYLFESGESHE